MPLAPRPAGTHAVARLLAALALCAAGSDALAAPRGRPAYRASGDAGRMAATSGDPVTGRVEALSAELLRDHASPRALVPLIELAGLEDEVPDLARLATLYARAADDAEAHPEVRAFARLRLAEVERARGNLRRAAAEVGRLGFLSGWWLAGPFDDEGKGGLSRVYPPERGQDLSARWPGKAREVGWRALPPEALTLGFAHLGAAVRPTREVVVYALTVVDAPREQRVRLYLGASGALEAWVNGVLVHVDPTYHPARLDQAAVEVTLREGPNRLLLKVAHADGGRLGFYARVTDAGGEPLRLLPHPAPLPPAARAPEAPVVTVPGVEAALQRAAARAPRGPEGARAQRDLALVLAERRTGEDREHRALQAARRAVELAPRDPDLRLLVARLEDDRNRTRAALDAALRLAPANPTVLAAVGQDERDRGRLASAHRLLARAVELAPAYPAARLALADLDEQLGLEARAAAARAELARSDPFHPAAVLAAARTARARDRAEEAARLLRKGLALRLDDLGARSALVQLLLDQADLDGAVRLLEEQLTLEPADLATRLRLADLLAANERTDAAEAQYAQALAINPEEAEVLERRGQARLRARRTREALADFQAALELKPQNPELKELVRAIEPRRERFEAPYLLDARALAASPAAAAPRPGDDALVLGELRVTRVYPSGLSSSVTQLVVKVLNARGADAWRTWAAPYTADRQELRVERARVLKPGGRWVEAFQESDASASEPWYRLYYDTRQRQLAFTSLAAGDVLEIQVRTDDVASDNLLSDYFGELHFLGGGHPKLRSEYVLLTPGGRRLFESAPAAGVERTERPLPGGLTERRWVAREVAAVRPEPGMPGWSEVVPSVHVSTYETWDDVARFYWGLVREQLVPTPEVRAVAQRLAAEVRAERRARGAPEAGDERALVEAAHRFVVTNTRYVGLEFGIHGYKPYRVDQILERRFGDCKDKASLTHALLEALGIDSRLVLLRMRRLGAMPARPASLAIFNHAILYVPRLDLWLDGTASYSGTHDLPAEDRGATVLVVNPGAAPTFGAIPEGRAEDNLVVRRLDLALDPDGGGRVRGESRVEGVGAPAYRRAYAAERDRRAVLEQDLGRTFPGLAVKELEVSDLGRLEEPVALRFALEQPRLAEREGAGLRVQPFGLPLRWTEAMAPLSTRTFDLVLGPPFETRLAARVAPPPGWAAGPLPPGLRLEQPFGLAEVSYRQEGGAIVAEARVVLRQGRIPAAQYAAFRDFLSQLDRALARPVRVAPPAGAAPATTAAAAGAPAEAAR